jgi:hypothetical protein
VRTHLELQHLRRGQQHPQPLLWRQRGAAQQQAQLGHDVLHVVDAAGQGSNLADKEALV